MMRGYLIVLALSWVASSLTLTATVARSATPQARAQSDEDEKHSSADADVKEKNTNKKRADDPDSVFAPPPSRGVKRLGKEFLEDQGQI